MRFVWVFGSDYSALTLLVVVLGPLVVDLFDVFRLRLHLLGIYSIGLLRCISCSAYGPYVLRRQSCRSAWLGNLLLMRVRIELC